MLFTAVLLAVFAPFLDQGNYSVMLSFFMLVPTLFGIIFATLWSQASDLFQNAPETVSASSFSKITASALAGGMTGGFLAKGLISYLKPKWLILVGAIAILIAAGVVIGTHRKFPMTIETKRTHKDDLRSNFCGVFSQKYPRTLLFISMIGAVAGLLIDFQYYVLASNARMDSQGSARFFANFYIIVNLSSLIFQLFLGPKIQDKFGLRGGLTILPLGILGGATLSTAVASALSRSVLKIAEGGLKSSFHRFIWEQAFIPVNSGERSSVKMLVDGIGARIAEGMGASLLFLWLRRVDVADPAALNTKWIAWTLLITVAVWLLLTRKLQLEITRESCGGKPPMRASENSARAFTINAPALRNSEQETLKKG